MNLCRNGALLKAVKCSAGLFLQTRNQIHGRRLKTFRTLVVQLIALTLKLWLRDTRWSETLHLTCCISVCHLAKETILDLIRVFCNLNASSSSFHTFLSLFFFIPTILTFIKEIKFQHNTATAEFQTNYTVIEECFCPNFSFLYFEIICQGSRQLAHIMTNIVNSLSWSVEYNTLENAPLIKANLSEKLVSPHFFNFGGFYCDLHMFCTVLSCKYECLKGALLH